MSGDGVTSTSGRSYKDEGGVDSMDCRCMGYGHMKASLQLFCWDLCFKVADLSHPSLTWPSGGIMKN
ncbi:hypothetical protein STEG23_030164, partial [Scotinomys teguina]